MAAELMGAAHGGRVLELAARLGLEPGQILDFSASINPLGPPVQALEAARQALEQVQHYPETTGDSLRQTLAERYGLAQAHLLVDAGSTPLIYRVVRLLAPQSALVVEPAFGEYHRALRQVGCRIEPLLVRPGTGFDPDIVLRGAQDVDLVVLANPGNPSGELVAREVLEQLLRHLPSGVQLLLDEAFVDFCPGASMVDAVGNAGKLWVLRSLTKFYAIPGLRAGWLAGPVEGIRRLEEQSWPWALSTPALAAARAALADEDYARRTFASVPAWRADLAEALGRLGFEVVEGAANYLLARLPAGAPDANSICARLEDQAILVRNCASFYGLDARWLRLAVRMPAAHAHLFTALETVLKGQD